MTLNALMLAFLSHFSLNNRLQYHQIAITQNLMLHECYLLRYKVLSQNCIIIDRERAQVRLILATNLECQSVDGV